MKYHKNESEWPGLAYNGIEVIKKIGEVKRTNGCIHDRLLVKCRCGKQYETCSGYIIKGNGCGCGRRKNLIGQKFGLGTVIEYANNDNNKVNWKLKCDCGNIYIASADSIICGDKSSCGCIKKNFQSVCTPLTLGRWWKRVRNNYSRYDFTITKDYVLNLLEQQRYTCNLSGLPITIKDGTASLDRIDSTLGYITGNVQFVHKSVNYMKSTLDQNEFIRLCSLIHYHTK